MVKPFLKWAEGKTELVPRILQNLPTATATGERMERFVEPFAGSCAVSLNAPFNRFLVADLNRDLIDLYRWLKRAGTDFIDDCEQLFDEGNNEHFYYACRQRFNETERGDYWRSLLFVYLNRHGYNGLCHHDERGRFDVPYGMYRKPYFPREEMVAFHLWAQRAAFIRTDFRAAMDCARPGDLLYCDPPNLPLLTVDGPIRPLDEKFSDSDQVALAFKAGELAKRGIPVVISNLDTAAARALYADAKLDTFPVRRYIENKRGARGKVWEVVAVYL